MDTFLRLTWKALRNREICQKTSGVPAGLHLLALLFLSSFLACSTQPQKDTEKVMPHDILNQKSLHVRPDTNAIRQKIAHLDSQLTQLKTKFKIHQKNLPVASYYHQNWSFRYYIQDNALMAGVDEKGVFFLIDSYNCSGMSQPRGGVGDYHGMELCDYKNSWLELRMKDSTIRIESDAPLAENLWPQVARPIQHDTWIGTGFFCTDYYPIVDNPKLMEILADSTVGYFKFYRYCDGKGRGDIGHAEKRDRKGIRDCANLSLLIKELAELRASIGE